MLLHYYLSAHQVQLLLSSVYIFRIGTVVVNDDALALGSVSALANASNALRERIVDVCPDRPEPLSVYL